VLSARGENTGGCKQSLVKVIACQGGLITTEPQTSEITLQRLLVFARPIDLALRQKCSRQIRL
jgi:hypothetical protein